MQEKYLNPEFASMSREKLEHFANGLMAIVAYDNGKALEEVRPIAPTCHCRADLDLVIRWWDEQAAKQLQRLMSRNFSTEIKQLQRKEKLHGSK